MGKIAVGAGVILALIMAMIAHTPVALAVVFNPQCDGASNVQTGGLWQPSNGDAEGIGAPILLRQDGNLCVNSGLDDFESPWIALEQVQGSGITQIGFDHDWNAQGGEHYCRFWAIGTGIPHDYDCSGTADGKYVFFRIQTYSTPGGNLLYSVDDCGTGGNFDNCTEESGNQAAYINNAFAEAGQEVDHPCVSQMLGSNPDPMNFGNSNWGTVGNNGGWNIKSWSGFVNSCSSDYKHSISGDIITIWDSRNTS